MKRKKPTHLKERRDETFVSSLNWRGSTTRGGVCGSIGYNARNITVSDGSMKVRLKTLPDEPRGGAWPSSARAVRCPVKSGKFHWLSYIPP